MSGLEQYVQLLSAIVLAPLLWVVKSLLGDARDLHREIAEHRKYCAEHYARRDLVNRELDEVKSLIIAHLKSGSGN